MSVFKSGNFPVAIRLCLEAKEAANTYHHFSCVSDLMTKLVGSTNLIEGALDEALSTFTMVFDQDQYVLVYSALTMLNKVELASRKLVNHFVTTLRKSSRKIVEEHCISDHCLVNVAEMSYEALCERIVPEHIVSTVRELCYVMCKILTIYHAILRFHNEDDERRRLGNLTEDTSIGVVMNYMISSLSGVFHVALSALRSLLCCQDFSSLKFEELLDIVDMTKRFHDFGHRFFGDSSDEIAVSLEKQAIAYFVHYHLERVEELRVFLENECFTLCPVPNQFTIFDLQIAQLTFGCYVAVRVAFRHVDFLQSQLSESMIDSRSFLALYMSQLHDNRYSQITMFFGFDGCEVDESHVKIKTVLADIVGRLLFDETRPTNKLFEESVRFVTPKLCAGLDLSHFDQLYGIAERIVAVESVEFVARQLYLVRPVVESLLAKPSEKVSWSLDRFYGNDFEEFSLRLECATKNIHLSDSVRTLLWEQTIFYTFKALVQGYCESGRCSTEGRALMQLDFQHLFSIICHQWYQFLQLEPICGLHPIPHCAFVEEYIKAFYLSENGLEEWIHKHSVSKMATIPSFCLCYLLFFSSSFVRQCAQFVIRF
uniref:Separase n=1 Tax=Angiostrongylus cantonensis TaxID=6313 RepID=A0A0K0D962_ANGCA